MPSRPDGALRASLASRGKPCGLSPPRRAWRPSKTAEPAAPARPDDSSHKRNQPCFPMPGVWGCASSLEVRASPAKQHGRSRCRAAHRTPCGVSPLRAFIVPSRCSADAYGPASRSGPARLRLRAGCTSRRPLPCPAVSPDFITLLATVARGRVPSRRARPCPRLRLRAAPTCRFPP